MTAIRVLNPDGLYPVCAQTGCAKLAEDGYCDAGCCVGFSPRRAYCHEHSHRSARVLELLGFGPGEQTFDRADVIKIVHAMWLGGDFVLGAAGKLEMERDIARVRAHLAQMPAPAPAKCPRCGTGELRAGSAAAAADLCFDCWAAAMKALGQPPTSER